MTAIYMWLKIKYAIYHTEAYSFPRLSFWKLIMSTDKNIQAFSRTK